LSLLHLDKYLNQQCFHQLQLLKYHFGRNLKQQQKELQHLKFELHYEYDKVVINTHYCSFEENTLNRLILPLCHYKGYKKVFILGFDGFSGRFYSKEPLKISPYVGRFDNLKKWVEWKPYTGMEILSVIPGPISNHIPNINFEQALELDNETNN
jgi:hypothetical protein